jgi:hypothetical protein
MSWIYRGDKSRHHHGYPCRAKNARACYDVEIVSEADWVYAECECGARFFVNVAEFPIRHHVSPVNPKKQPLKFSSKEE